MMKKLVSLFMAMAMVFSLSATAFAANTSTDTLTGSVTVTLQTGNANTIDYTQLPTNVQGIDTVTVQLAEADDNNDGVVTVKEIVNAILDDDVVTCANNGVYGCDGCTCASCVCTWKKAAVYDTNTWEIIGYASALNSLKYGQATYTANGGSIPVDDVNYLYEGDAWEYWVDGTYAEDYMDQHVVTGGENIILSYDHSRFYWSY